MYLSVVILSFNSARHIDKCLSALYQSMEALGVTYEVFVVENGSSDNSLEKINVFKEQFGEALRIINLEKNTGTTYSRNQAIKRAKGQFVLVLDSDAYVTSESLKRLTGYLQEHPNVGIAVPRITYASGNFQLSCDQFPTLWSKLKRFFLLKKMESQSNALADAVEPVIVDYAISACWMLPKAVIDKVGLLDEAIFYSPEDVDYCIRVWKAGYEIHYLPDVSIVHDAQELSRGFKISLFHFSHLKGIFYLMMKHNYLFGIKKLYKHLGRE